MRGRPSGQPRCPFRGRVGLGVRPGLRLQGSRLPTSVRHRGRRAGGQAVRPGLLGQAFRVVPGCPDRAAAPGAPVVSVRRGLSWRSRRQSNSGCAPGSQRLGGCQAAGAGAEADGDQVEGAFTHRQGRVRPSLRSMRARAIRGRPTSAFGSLPLRASSRVIPSPSDFALPAQSRGRSRST
jgi:hypothetical protein